MTVKRPRPNSNRFVSTTRHRAKSTAGTGRIGHGSATHQTANLCDKLNCASLPRPQGRAGALNLGDDSGRHEDLWNHGEHRDHGEKNTEKRNTTEENEINVRQVDPGDQTVLDRNACL